MASYLGIDPATSESKPSGCAVLDGSAALVYVGMAEAVGDPQEGVIYVPTAGGQG